MQSDFVSFAIACALGALGGFLHALVLGENRLRIPRRIPRSKTWDLSFLGDIFVGMGGAVAVLYMVSPLDLAKLASISIAAGLGAARY